MIVLSEKILKLRKAVETQLQAIEIWKAEDEKAQLWTQQDEVTYMSESSG